ncbi:MAG: hypothetical protein ABEJ03_05055 [Candidatus Nanohaloarchaea archaeon]
MTENCGECGKKFGSMETLREHHEVEHPGKELEVEEETYGLSELVPERNFTTGIFFGVLLVVAAFGTAEAYSSLTSDPVEITVVTCGNCSYERFKVATDRLFDVRYTEVNYKSRKGQELIEKYEINYVPGFVFEKEVEERDNVSRVRNALVEFEDAYVMSDRRNRAAQRFSKGFSIR